MSRAGLSGFLIGGTVAIVGVGALSILSEPPRGPELSTDVVQAEKAPEIEVNETVVVNETAAPSVPDKPVQTSLEPEPKTPESTASLTPATNATPSVDVKGVELNEVAQHVAGTSLATHQTEPVSPKPQVILPDAPNAETEAAIDTAPASPTQVIETVVLDELPDSGVPTAPPSEQGSGLDSAVSQDQTVTLLSTPQSLLIPAVVTAPEITTSAPVQELDVATPEADEDVAPAEAVETELAQASPAASSRPTIGTPAKSLITQSVQPVEAPNPTDTSVASEEVTSGALETFKQPFSDPEGRPPLSIVLMDTGQKLDDGPIGLQALGSFPYAISFAVDAELPDAADRAAVYRSQGFEVLALVDLPQSLTAADTEVALTAALDAVPESVGILEGAETGLQGNKDISDQVTAIAADTGHGLLWRPNGLDTAQKLAARDGVPSKTIFRDFDSKDQTPTVIRRFLDQAAFKAGQENGVVMVGRVRPDTISALLIWGLQDRAQRVAVSPVSAVLSPENGQ